MEQRTSMSFHKIAKKDPCKMFTKMRVSKPGSPMPQSELEATPKSLNQMRGSDFHHSFIHSCAPKGSKGIHWVVMFEKINKHLDTAKHTTCQDKRAHTHTRIQTNEQHPADSHDVLPFGRRKQQMHQRQLLFFCFFGACTRFPHCVWPCGFLQTWGASNGLRVRTLALEPSLVQCLHARQTPEEETRNTFSLDNAVRSLNGSTTMQTKLSTLEEQWPGTINR
eukprot:2440819-Amphidinium_carterae.1